MLSKYLQKLFQNCMFILCLALILQISKISSSLQPTSLGVHMLRSPESTVAPHGDEVLFECELNLSPETLKWRFRPLNSKTNGNDFIFLDKNAGYNITKEDVISKLRIYVSTDTLGEYQCVAWFGSAAIASITAKLTLATIGLNESNNGLRQINKPSEETLKWNISPKNSVLIKCGNVISNPPAVWNFYKNDISIPQTEPQLPSGAFILNSVTSKDSGIYSCSAVNSITGNKIKLPNKIQLNIENTLPKSPEFLIEPSHNMSVRPGQTIILECPGIGNPPPKSIWTRQNVNLYNNERMKIFDYGLQILNVTTQDRGVYICRLDNGIQPSLTHTIQLEISEPPIILKGPQATLTNESDPLELECIAKGSPIPEIYWMINGIDTRRDSSIKHDSSKLIIKSIEKKHAGIVQCFAKNELGEANESNLLQVNPKQIPGEIGNQPLGSFPTKSTYDHPGKQNKGRKKHKIPNMIPPSRPNVTRLSDDSVMIRWFVPENDGLPIQFFKVQYRMLGNPSKKIPRENWQTTNDDIPFVKRSKSKDGIKNFTSAVNGLKPDRYYRFRILAVYSNNDNKEGNSSEKFLLRRASQLGASKSHLPPPILTEAEGVSETAILLHWSFPMNPSHPIEGFYAYYRSTSSAGEYLKATIDGMHTRHFKIDMLEPGDSYEFKLQSFTESAASEFSSIITGKTLKATTPPPLIVPSVVQTSEASKNNNTFLPVIGGAVGGGVLLLVAIIVTYICIKKRKNSQREDENKEQLDHIQADGNHFVPPNVMGSQHHKSGHRMNGVTARMNITPNPLAQESQDKNRNVMELRFMPTSTTSTAATLQQSSVGLNQLGIPIAASTTATTVMGQTNHHQQSPQSHHLYQQHSQPFHHQHQTLMTAPSSSSSPVMHSKFSSSGHNLQNHNHNNNNNNTHQQNNSSSLQQHPQNHPNLHHYQQQQPGTPSLDQHRRTLERSARNLHYNPQHTSTMDSADGISIPTSTTRIPSLRRTRRTSGSNGNNNNGVVIVPGSPRVQRSPMPVRSTTAAAIKRNRLGSHTENMSSGSLNSIEV